MLQSRPTLQSVLAFSLGLLLSACSSKPGDELVGVWTIDNEATMAANPGMSRTNKVFSFEFTKDGKIISRRDNKEHPAVYIIKNVEGETLTLDVKSGEGEKLRTEELGKV